MKASFEAPPEEAARVCIKCSVHKSLDQFYLDKARGRRKTVCKECYPRPKKRPTAVQRAQCDPQCPLTRTQHLGVPSPETFDAVVAGRRHARQPDASQKGRGRSALSRFAHERKYQ